MSEIRRSGAGGTVSPAAHSGPAGTGSGTGGHTGPGAVLTAAKRWVGKSFQPGEKEQCANFVRAVFKEAGVGIPSAARPSDTHLLPPGSGLGPGSRIVSRAMLTEAAPT